VVPLDAATPRHCGRDQRWTCRRRRLREQLGSPGAPSTLMAAARRVGRPLVAHVADDHRAVTEPELGAVVLADPHSFGEAECRRQPGDGLADVGVDQWGKTVAAGMQRLALYRPMQPVS